MTATLPGKVKSSQLQAQLGPLVACSPVARSPTTTAHDVFMDAERLHDLSHALRGTKLRDYRVVRKIGGTPVLGAAARPGSQDPAFPLSCIAEHESFLVISSTTSRWCAEQRSESACVVARVVTPPHAIAGYTPHGACSYVYEIVLVAGEVKRGGYFYIR